MLGKKFEGAVHNAEVKRLVLNGQKHKNLTDDWADIHYIEVKAMDVDEARKKLTRRYPAEQGFVIESVKEV